jgi:hypothetical protein
LVFSDLYNENLWAIALTTALVTLLHINLGQITGTSDLDIVFGTDKMNAFEGTFRHDAGASAALSAPSDFVPLSVANSANRGRRPQAEIIGIVHPHCLAVRGLRRLGAAGVGTKLTTLRLGGQLVVTKKIKSALLGPRKMKGYLTCNPCPKSGCYYPHDCCRSKSEFCFRSPNCRPSDRYIYPWSI